MRVRDLEIALVLAREMKAAAERSVDASLRLDQLQEVFGVQELDQGERARIQTALQMAGLEPFPSLLEADPSEPIRFGSSKTAVAASGGATAVPPPPPPPDPAPAEQPAEAQAQPTFPTVGEFARSKLRSRRFGVRRGDHGEDESPPPPPDPPEPQLNGHPPDEAAIEDEVAVEHVVDEEVVDDEALYDEPEPEHVPVPEPEPEPEPEQREYIPVAPEEPVAYEEPEPAPERSGASSAQVAAVLLPAVAIPVIATSIAGWRFGLPFVALSLIATGWVVGRERTGFFASIRGSRAARTALTVTVVVTALSVGAAVLLVALRDSSSTTKGPVTPAKQPAKPPVASVPVKPATKSHKKKHKAKASKRATSPAPATQSTPPPDPATEGLIRVPPSGGTSKTP